MNDTQERDERPRLMYEEQLPEDMSAREYGKWFQRSAVIDGVRMGPLYPFASRAAMGSAGDIGLLLSV